MFMKNLLPALPLLLLATDAHARVVHTNSGMDPGMAIFLSIAVTVALSIIVTRIMRVMRKR
jgi:hypothetical protein